MHCSESKAVLPVPTSVSESGEAVETIGNIISNSNSKNGRINYATEVPLLENLLDKKSIKKVNGIFVYLSVGVYFQLCCSGYLKALNISTPSQKRAFNFSKSTAFLVLTQTHTRSPCS